MFPSFKLSVLAALVGSALSAPLVSAASRQAQTSTYCVPVPLSAGLWHRRKHLRELVHGPEGKCPNRQEWQLQRQQQQEQDRQLERILFLELLEFVTHIALSTLVFEFVEFIGITWVGPHGHLIWFRYSS
ncbi:hypothetical protein Emag_003768 [Eimeria magna]